MARGRWQDSDGELILTGYNFSTLIAGGASSEKKIFLQNDQDVDSGILTLRMIAMNNADGNASALSEKLAWLKCTKTLSCPFAVQGSALTGGTLTADTPYYYRVTARNNNAKETTGSREFTFTPDALNKSVQLSWEKPSASDAGNYSPTGYRVYRSTVSNSFDNCFVKEVLGGDTLSFIDTGYALSGVNLPLENTTGGASPEYGTSPSSGWAPAPSGVPADDLSVGVLKSGEQFPIWVKSVIDLSSTKETQAAAGIMVLES